MSIRIRNLTTLVTVVLCLWMLLTVYTVISFHFHHQESCPCQEKSNNNKNNNNREQFQVIVNNNKHDNCNNDTNDGSSEKIIQDNNQGQEQQQRGKTELFMDIIDFDIPKEQQLQQQKQLPNNSQNRHAVTVKPKPANNSNNGNSADADVATVKNDDKEDDEPEFPYRLSCPGQVLSKRTSTKAAAAENTETYRIILGYHVGMLRNWKTVVRDQITTLTECGLGAALDEWWVSYSVPPSKYNHNNSTDKLALEALLRHELLQHHQQQQRQSNSNNQKRRIIPVDPQLIPSKGIPWEGTLINHLREQCQKRGNVVGKDTSTNTTTRQRTVVFYWHTKGTSRYRHNWRQQQQGQQQNDQPYTYSRILYWRKYMEYFLHERPAYCLHWIIQNHAMTCGVDRKVSRGIYGGNFWVADCQYLIQLPWINITTPTATTATKKSLSSHYFDAEQAFGMPQKGLDRFCNQTFVSLHQPNPKLKGFYYRLIEPSEYANHLPNWGPSQGV